MQGGQFGRLGLPGVPNIKIALDGSLLLFFLLLAYVLLPLLYLHQIAYTAFPPLLLQLRMRIPMLSLRICPQLSELFSKQRQSAVELMVFFGFVFGLFLFMLLLV